LLVTEAWREKVAGPALSARQLDLFYRVKRFVPRAAQLALRRLLIRRQGSPVFPRWPFEPSLVELLRLYVACIARFTGVDDVRFRWFWPHSARGALILTHDVESAEGLRLAVELADLEEERGFRSSFNVVADWYPLDHGILRELRRRGFEIGIHGIYHDRSLFASRASFERQLPALAVAAEELEAVGFRSPATHRVVEWLPELPVEYDCTMPHSDPYEPMPGGCCSIWPFAIGKLLELPYTLPQDHTVLTLLRRREIDLWLEQVDVVVRNAGLVQSVSHPDPGYLGDADKRRLFVEFLDRMADRSDLWRPLPREVASWWRRREAGEGTEAVWPAGAELTDVSVPASSDRLGLADARPL